jgi:glycosyltransferase involved in cell wall biosynthesis
MRIAIVSPYAPFDGVDHAGGAFLHAYVSYLSRDHAVDLICTETPNEQTRASYASSVAVHFSPPAEGRGTSRPRLQARTLTGYNTGALQVDALISDRDALQILAVADIVDLQWSELLRALPQVRRERPRKPIVATEHDVHAQAMASLVRSQSNRQAGVETIPLRRRLFARLGIYTESYFLNKCDLVQVFKAEDVTALRRAGLRRPAVVIDPSIDQSPQALGAPDSKALIFVGMFSRGPNAEGARWFIREVWPTIHRSVPGASLVLAGVGSDRVLSECPAEGAEATGYVADLKLAYDKCAIAIAPLMRGAGLKFKVPQALAYGLPVVTTTVGAEGMPPGCPAIVTDSASEMAGAIIGLLQAPDELRRLGEAGRSWATAVFDFSRSMDKVERRFEELLRRP